MCVIDNCKLVIGNWVIGGTAVYKARTLHAIYAPNAQYNDRVLCIPQTLNKNANSGSNNNYSIDLDSLAEAQLLSKAGVVNYIAQIENNNFITTKELLANYIAPQLLPNPSNGTITIIYNQNVNGVLELYNSQGQLIESIKLEAGNKRIETQLQNVVSGIYEAKFIFDKIATNSKLTILK
jgi:Secretion system C-terminal sorting domain